MSIILKHLPKEKIKYLFFQSLFKQKKIENIFHPKVHEIIENELNLIIIYL